MSQITHLNRRTALATLLSAMLVRPAAAAPVPYSLDRANSRVAFAYVLNGQEARGKMPVRDATISLDFDRLSRSTVTAVLDPTKATAGFIFATEAMRGASVLNVNQFPTITFQATNIRAEGFVGEMDGNLTVRGVTRPVTLKAQVFRQRGTERSDRSRLSIQLTGGISRTAFGASGFPDLVGDRIDLDILVRITRDG